MQCHIEKIEQRRTEIGFFRASRQSADLSRARTTRNFHGPAIEPPTEARAGNRAERALRGPVIHRKLSLGSQSERGETTTQRLLSASVICRLQGRSLFAYLADVLGARVRGDPAPLLA